MTYLNSKKMASEKIIAALLIVIGAALAAFWCIGYAIFDSASDMAITSVFVVINVLILLLGIRKRKRIGDANRLNSLLEGDADGIRKISDLADDLGKTKAEVITEMEWLLRHHYLKDCTLERGEEPVVYMRRQEETWVAPYVMTKCSHCGAVVKVRAHSTGKCEYCGGDVTAD